MLGAISLDLFAVLLGGAVGAAAGLCARHPGTRTVGPRPAALRAGHRRRSSRCGSPATRSRTTPASSCSCFVGLFGVFTVVFGVSTLTWLSIVALALLGATDMVSVYVRETLIQLWTPDEVRGRVNAVNMVFVGASNEVGEFRAGMMAAADRHRPGRGPRRRRRGGGGGALGGTVSGAEEDPASQRPRLNLNGASACRRSAPEIRPASASDACPRSAGRRDGRAPGWAPGSTKRWAPRTTQRCIITRVSSAWNWMPQAFLP